MSNEEKTRLWAEFFKCAMTAGFGKEEGLAEFANNCIALADGAMEAIEDRFDSKETDESLS